MNYETIEVAREGHLTWLTQVFRIRSSMNESVGYSPSSARREWERPTLGHFMNDRLRGFRGMF